MSLAIGQTAGTPEAAPTPIAPDVFFALISGRVQSLLALAVFLDGRTETVFRPTRPLAGALLSEAAQIVELLDAYGARNNQQWHQFRQLVATLKTFADAAYKLLHIIHSHPSYRLLPVKGDFAAESERALDFCARVIRNVAERLLLESRRQEIPASGAPRAAGEFVEDLPGGRLPHNRAGRTARSCEETVAHLATAFLNLAAESECLQAPLKVKPEEYASCFPDPLNEEEFRQLEHKFHNLQSLYDTYISDTDTELLDADLPVLRGHITVIFHLLEVATGLGHHYERHLRQCSPDSVCLQQPLVDMHALLQVLVSYAVCFCGRYLSAARHLCQEMLRRYARIERIDVPVPNYRGFHVRPSTLVAKIVHHYGSEVRMEMDGEMYDASAPLDLFRANEKINREKRRRLAAEISGMDLALPAGLEQNLLDAVRQIVTNLAAQGKLVIYERPLPLEELRPESGEPLSQFVVDEITRLLVMGKIDIEARLQVAFVGDRRVLDDIRLLAESGYGEDNFGNNIPLPKKLSYLRR